MILVAFALMLQTPPGAVPDLFRGEWAEAPADCAYPALRVKIDARGIGRGARVWHAAQAEAISQDRDGLHWTFTSNDPESGTWVTRYTLGWPNEDQTTLVRDSKDGTRTFQLRRCPSTAGPVN